MRYFTPEKDKRKITRTESHHYALLELISALIILAILTTSFLTVVNSMHHAQRVSVVKSRAILLLDNTLERVESAPPPRTAKQIEKIFYDEFKKSTLYGDKQISKTCEIRNRKLFIKIKNQNKVIAEIAVRSCQ